MSTVATIWVKLGLDSKAYSAGLNKSVSKTASAASKMGKSLRSAGQSVMKTGGIITAGLTLPIIGIGVAAIKGASDLEQSIGGVESVFKSSADTIFKFGKTAAESVGLSRKEFNSLATVGGALLKNVGFPLEEVANETINLTKRASDMAATFGGPVSGAMEAIQSALKGEFNPLEQFGVKMNQTAINAKALELGLGEMEKSVTDIFQAELDVAEAQEAWNKVVADGKIGTDEAMQASINFAKASEKLEKAQEGTLLPLSDNAKAQAALAILYEQTADSAGQFAKESNTVAGQIERTKAKLENMRDELGTKLLPIGLKIVEFLSGLIDKFNALTPAQQQTILMVAGVVAAIGPLIAIIGAIVTAIGFLFSPIGLIIAAIVLLFVAWKKNWGGIREKTATAIDFIKGVISEFLNNIKAWWAENGEAILAKAKAIWDGILNVINWFKEQWTTIFSAFRSAQEGDWHAFGEKLRIVWDNIWEKIKDILARAWTAIKIIVGNLITNVVDFFKNTDWKQLGINIVKGIGAGLKSMMGWIADQARNVANAALDAAKGFLGIQSKSKAFEKLGMFSAMGFGAGFQGTMGKLQPAMNVSMAGGDIPSTSGASQDDSFGAGNSGFDEVKLARAIRDVFLREKL